MPSNNTQAKERVPAPSANDSVAAAEMSLYRNVLRIKQEHSLLDLGISFYDAESTIQWSYNADRYFHAASTMKLAVLLAVFRQVDRGELTLESPVHVRNRFTSIVNQEPFMLDLGRDADPDVYGHLGKTLTVMGRSGTGVLQAVLEFDQRRLHPLVAMLGEDRHEALDRRRFVLGLGRQHVLQTRGQQG